MPNAQNTPDPDRAGPSVRDRSLVIFLGLVGLIGFVLIIFASRWGPWAFSDGVGYMVTARNLIQGDGFGLYRPSGTFVPSVMHPPLLASLIAISSVITGDVLSATRLLGSVLFLALLVAIPLLVKRSVGFSGLAALLAILLITHPAVILMFLSAMSEPLFVFAGTTSLLIVGLYLTRPRPISLALACAFAATAMLTRYAGLAYVATGGLAILLFDGRGSLRQRLARAGAYSAAALLPTLIFLAYWMQTPYARSVRGFALPSSIGESVSLFISRSGLAAWSWKPVPTPEVLAAVTGSLGELVSLGLVITSLLLAGIAIAISFSKELAKSSGDQDQLAYASTRIMLQVFSLFVLVFSGMMLAVFTFSLPRPDIDARTLFPLLPTIMIILIGYAGLALSARPSSKVPLLLASGLLLVVAAGSAPASIDIVSGLHRTGLGYTAKAWHESAAIERVMELDPETILISNSPEAIMLFTGRSAHPVPLSGNEAPSSQELGGGITATTADELICTRGGVLVLFEGSFDGVDQRSDPESTFENLSCQLAAIYEGADGSIYRSEDALQ